MKRLLAGALCVASSAIITVHPAMATEVRLCDGPLRSAPLSDERDVQSALIQAFSVVNDGTAPVALRKIQFQIKADGVAQDSRWLLASDVARAVRQGPMVQALGSAIPSQLCNGRLLEGTKLASTATLAPGEAVVFMHEPFFWQGRRDTLEIVAVTEREGVVANCTASVAINGARSQTRALFPVPGRSYVAVAGSFHTPHRWAVIEEFALDILALGKGGATHRGTGERLSDYFAFGKPVRAVAAGRVVHASGALPDNAAMLKRANESSDAYLARLLEEQGKLLGAGIEAVLGNHVVIDHGNGEFSVYAHLKQNSLRVAAGDSVAAGATIGLLGSSGNSTEPHLHFQICDSADMNRCKTLPIDFDGINLPLELAPRT